MKPAEYRQSGVTGVQPLLRMSDLSEAATVIPEVAGVAWEKCKPEGGHRMFPVINPWMFVNPDLTRWMPLGGPFQLQDINPVTRWLSPNLDINFAGKPDVEKDIVANIASYGRQLGVIIPALLELAGDNNSPEVEKLRTLAGDIEAAKQKHKIRQAETLKQGLLSLKETDPEAFRSLLESVADQKD